MNKIINKIKLILPIILISTMIGGISASATNSSIIQNESPVLIGDSNSSNGIIPNQVNSVGGDGLSKAEDYVERKLFDVVGFCQSFIKPLTYVTFIVSTIMLLFGVVTASKSKFKGLLGMAFSIFVYVLVVFAPQIVEYFSSWLSVI